MSQRHPEGALVPVHPQALLQGAASGLSLGLCACPCPEMVIWLLALLLVTLTEEVKRLYGCSRLGLNILGLFARVRSPGLMVSCPVPLRGASGGWSIGVNGADLDLCLVLDGEQLSLMVFLQFY